LFTGNLIILYRCMRFTDQHRPSFTSETVTAIVEQAAGRYRTLYALCAASGMRIGEVRGLEIDLHSSIADCPFSSSAAESPVCSFARKADDSGTFEHPE
jgi:hypothetical protein